MDEYVVLVSETNKPLGTLEKLTAHDQNTPLHRGISVFLFNQQGKLLLQQRSKNKKTWPLVWSNSCCGHPTLEETSIQTAKRRLRKELGITDAILQVVLPDYRYKCEKDGIYENEFCPVIVGITQEKPTYNAEEVAAIKWLSWNNWIEEITNNPENYSAWCVEESFLLQKTPEFHHFLQEAMKKLQKR